ncbi:hypothetical protein DMX06_18965 [Pseudomonas mosselii]|nr:hypothetical protein DMX06_18965 [Pseudomonas mosselii]
MCLREGQTRRNGGEEAECTGVHEHSEPRFNAVWASAGTFRTEPGRHAFSVHTAKDKINNTREGGAWLSARPSQDSAISPSRRYR